MATQTLDELNGGNSLGALIWQSGRIVRQWEAVVSPANGEVYRRKTATGAGTTDPATDRVNYRAVSYEAITAVNNGFSAGQVVLPSSVIAITGGNFGINSFTSNANQRKAILSLSGRGVLTFAALQMSAATAKTLRYEVLADGLTVFDANIVQSVNQRPVSVLFGALGGSPVADTYTALPDRMDFRTSLEIFITSSVAVASNNMYAGFTFRSLES